ncbi:MAG: hypothetical protein KJ674_04395 [Nanoarchaeota archaeon]|nr:hypothetical protein [Nanoarchaeota archaeon]
MKNSVIDRIENQLNKLFENLDTIDSIKVSFILSKLDLSFILKNKSQKSPFNPESFLKMYLYKRIKVIRRYPDILKQLLKDEQEVYHLGFHKDKNNELLLPKKRTYNQFLQEYVDEETKELLGIIAERILSIATQNKVILDLEIIKKKIRENNNKRKRIKEATKLVKKLIYPQIDIKIKENGKFTTKDLLDVLVHIAQTHDFCNNGSLTFKELNQDKEAPHGNTLLYHFRKLKSLDQLKISFETVFDVIFNFAKRNYKELRRRKLDIAIDIHKIPYYGNKNDPYVAEGKYERGTTHFYVFITCSIVVAGKRFTLDALPIHKLDSLEDLVNKIIKRAKSKINIDKVFLDREFDKPNIINVLKKNRVKFIMPKIRSKTVKAWMRKSENCKARVIKDFEIGKNKAVVNLILVDDKESIKRAFITNFDIPFQLTHYLYSWYSKRWGIETSYRNMDHDFKPRTTSKNYCIRLFYFLFTVCLYNLWVLVNICISLTLYGRVLEKPIITAKLFSIVLYKVSVKDPPQIPKQ